MSMLLQMDDRKDQVLLHLRLWMMLAMLSNNLMAMIGRDGPSKCARTDSLRAHLVDSVAADSEGDSEVAADLAVVEASAVVEAMVALVEAVVDLGEADMAAVVVVVLLL